MLRLQDPLGLQTHPETVGVADQQDFPIVTLGTGIHAHLTREDPLSRRRIVEEPSAVSFAMEVLLVVEGDGLQEAHYAAALPGQGDAGPE